VGEADGAAVEGEQPAFRVAMANSVTAHVAADRIKSFIGKQVQHGLISNVAGMDDNIAGVEALLNLFFELTVRSMTMRIGKYSGVNYHGVWVDCGGLGRRVKKPVNKWRTLEWTCFREKAGSSCKK
jgi:hypothetical protein